MKRFPIWVVFAAFVGGALLTLSAVYLLPGKHPAARATMAASVKPEILYWYDPMYPDKRFERPGKSPFMDMQLVPKYAKAVDRNADAPTDTLRIDARVAQNLGVRTGLAVHGALVHEVRTTASVAFDERATSTVQARVNGIVERLIVRTPFATVTAGEPLLLLLAPEWTAAQEEYLALRNSTAPSLTAVREAARRRLGLLGMGAALIREIERSGQAQARVTVYAPRAGVVSELAVREGESVMAGATLVRINGTDTMWAQAAIAETQIRQIRVGSSARLVFAAFPGQEFNGTVEAMLATVDAASRTQTARIVLDNRDQRLTPGMVGEAHIRAPTEAFVLVPSEAVIATGSRQVIIVVDEDAGFRAQEVRIGAEANGQSEVRAGLEAGERVVLSGQFLIDSEASLSGALSRLGRDSEQVHEGGAR